jgi:hypothetical protein
MAYDHGVIKAHKPKPTGGRTRQNLKRPKPLGASMSIAVSRLLSGFVDRSGSHPVTPRACGCYDGSLTGGHPDDARRSDERRSKPIAGRSQCTTLDGVADYAARGRKFKSLSEDQLTDHFVETFRKLADDLAKWEHRALTKDLVAEFQTRNTAPPYDLVSEEFDRVCEAVLKHLDTKRKTQISMQE